ncbi:MAG: translocation/assembly module TamB domain-containing protein [Hyphomonadaceae bacterium]
MERAKKRRRYPIWLRIALGLMILVALLAASAVALRFWITSDGGRAFILSQIDGRKVGPFGTLRLSGLKGDPLQAATLADIALVDDEGVWLRAKDARIEWTPTALFSGELEISSIEINTVDVVRKPLLANQQDENTPPPDIGLRLDKVSVKDLRLAEPVIGIEARYSIAGGAAVQRDGSGFSRITLSPVSGPADKADISAEWTKAGGVKGSANLSGPAGGLIAAVLQSPGDQPVALTADVAGTIETFTTKGNLNFGSDSVASFRLARTGLNAVLDAQIMPGRWPMLAEVAKRTGAQVDLHGEAKLTDLAHAPALLRITAPAGIVEAATQYDFTTWELPAEIGITATSLDLSTIAPPLSGRVDATGPLLLNVTGISWKGNVIANRMAWPSGRADRITTPLAIGFQRYGVTWEAMGAVIEGARVDALGSLAPARYKASVRGEMNLRTGLIEISGSQVEGAPGSVAARGSYDAKSGAMDLQGSARFNRLADVAPLTGAAQGRWSVKRASNTSPIRINADLEGRNVGSSNATLAEIAGPSPRVTLNGVVSNGRFAIESGTINGAALRATMTGRITDAGGITGSASGVLHRRLDLGGARIETAAFDADVTGTVKQPQVKLRLHDAAITAAGITIDALGGTAEARLGDAITGRFLLNGKSELGAFNASGDIKAGEGDWRIERLNANLGDLKFAASRLGFADGALAAVFTASGPLAGIAGIDKGALTASGTVRAGKELTANVTGRLTDIRSAGVRLDLVSFEAKASGGAATVEAHARGSVGAPLDLNLITTGKRQGEGWTGDATLTGSVDQLPIKTSRPAIWKQGPNGWSLDAAFTALRGDINVALANEGRMATARVEMQNVNLRGLSRLARITPIAGTVTGTATFANGDGPASGELRIKVANANPVGVTADPVTLNIAAVLRDGIVTSDSTGEGQGFSMKASSRFAIVEGDGFAIAASPDAPMTSQVDLHGRAEQLWALFGPEDQSLRGVLDANLRATGTLLHPILEGGVTVAEGAYEHSATGLALRDISARGMFDQNSARITDVKANDGKGGTLTGQGEITWNGDVHGGITFNASNLRALGRDDRLVILSGDGAMQLREEDIAITGKFAIQQARISIEQPPSESIPTIPGLRRVNFPNQIADDADQATTSMPWQRPVQLDLQVTAPRRIMIFGRGLDTEWGANLHITGPISDPSIAGTATLERGDLDLAGRRFAFDTGTITLDGPIRLARIDIAADRSTADITASVRITGTPVEPKFTLESTPALPQDEVLARVLFGRSIAQLSGFEAAQLAAGLAQLAGGQAGFDPVGLVRKATGLDRVTFGAENGIASVSAGKYIAENVYLQVGAGGAGGVGAEVEWEPTDNLSISSAADGNGDTKLAVRWKKDY